MGAGARDPWSGLDQPDPQQQGNPRQPDVIASAPSATKAAGSRHRGDASHRVSVRPGQAPAGWAAVDGTLVGVQIVILAGGVGGSRFAAGALRAYPEADVTVVGNTADDITLHGLRICPDLDTIMYTLGGGGDEQRGWGRQDESWRALEELVAYAAEPTWFAIGDRDLATHLVRTQLLDAGYPLSEVTAALTRRWLAAEPRVRLLPMTDDRVETHVTIADEAAPGGRRAVHFQEYWVRLHARPRALAVNLVGIESTRPAPGGGRGARGGGSDPRRAEQPGGLDRADPRRSRDARGAARESRRRWSGSPESWAARPCWAWPSACCRPSGSRWTPPPSAEHYGARSRGGVLDVWAMDLADAGSADRVRAAGLRPVVTELIMRDPEATAAFIAYAVKSGTESSTSGQLDLATTSPSGELR